MCCQYCDYFIALFIYRLLFSLSSICFFLLYTRSGAQRSPNVLVYIDKYSSRYIEDAINLYIGRNTCILEVPEGVETDSGTY